MNNIEKMKGKIVEPEKQLEIKDSEIASLKRQLTVEINKIEKLFDEVFAKCEKDVEKQNENKSRD